MARSLTVTPEEDVRTSPLLTGFLVFAVLWMGLAAVMAGTAEAETAEPPAAVAE